MFYIEVIFIAISLSMDALAVSITNGYLIKSLKIRHAFRIAFFFGFFQFLMPLIGWAIGINIAKFFQKFDHLIAFGILVFLGVKMILSSKKLEVEPCENNNSNKEKKTCLDFSFLILMSIATSIDAFAVGLSFAILKVLILIPVLIIGVITFVICFIGVFIGNKIGHLFEKKLEALGGIILILIGTKILIEHLLKNI